MVKSLLMLPAKGTGLRTAVSLAMASGIFCRNWSCLFESWMNHNVIVLSLVKMQLISKGRHFTCRTDFQKVLCA